MISTMKLYDTSMLPLFVADYCGLLEFVHTYGARISFFSIAPALSFLPQPINTDAKELGRT